MSFIGVIIIVVPHFRRIGYHAPSVLKTMKS